MNKILFVALVLVPILAKSQDQIIFRNGKELNCKITKIDSLSIFYNSIKDGRTLESYAEKNEIRSYRSMAKLSDQPDSTKTVVNNQIIVDTSVYVRDPYTWINLLTYSPQFGTQASGWSLQYYGYALNNNKWMIPCIFSFESLHLNSEFFDQLNYQSVNINYFKIGICPFRRLDDIFYANIGFQVIVGNEKLVKNYSQEINNTIFGITPSQGIYLIPKSKFGLTFSIGLYEKIWSSEVYKNDIGVKFELGLKF